LFGAAISTFAWVLAMATLCFAATLISLRCARALTLPWAACSAIPVSWFGLPAGASVPWVNSAMPPPAAATVAPWLIHPRSAPANSAVWVPETQAWSAGVRLIRPSGLVATRCGALQAGASPSPPPMALSPLPPAVLPWRVASSVWRRCSRPSCAGADRSTRAARQLHAKSAVRAAHVVLAALQVAEGEGRGVLGGGKLGAALAGRVVQAQHLVAAAAVLAAGQGLALEAGVDGGVVVAVEPGGRVAGGPGTAAGHLVVRGVGLAAAVVEHAHHHRPVNVAFQERHQHFLPLARDRHRAPVVARPRRGNPHPGPGAAVARRIVIAAGVRRAAAGIAPPLPWELHLDPVIAIGQQRPAVAHHNRTLGAVHGGPGMQAHAVSIMRAGPVRHAGGQGGEIVAVEVA